MIYDRVELTAQNCRKNWSAIIKIKGFTMRLVQNNLSLSLKVSEWSHLVDNFEHFSQDSTFKLYSFKLWCSSMTISGETQPRSHCNDFIAFSGRFFDINQIGVSGTFWSKSKLFMLS